MGSLSDMSMWHKNLGSHYKIELTWEGNNQGGLELIIIKQDKKVDYNNLIHEDADGRMWLEKEQESRTMSIAYVGKILWCMNCKIEIFIKPLYSSYQAKNIVLSIYKENERLEEISIDEEELCSAGKLSVCTIEIPSNLYEVAEIII